MAILYPATQRVHSYTVLLYTFKIYRWVGDNFGHRFGAMAFSFAMLLLTVVPDIVLTNIFHTPWTSAHRRIVLGGSHDARAPLDPVMMWSHNTNKVDD